MNSNPLSIRPDLPIRVKLSCEVRMAAQLVSQMTKEELRQLIDDVLDEKLIELFGDPDDGLELSDDLKKRLLRQREAVQGGERGKPLADIMKELGL